MTDMLKLPSSVLLADVPGLWQRLEASLHAECLQLRHAAAQELQLDAAELLDFDSAALTLLLSAARLCRAQGLTLKVRGMPEKLRELARVYGVENLLA